MIEDMVEDLESEEGGYPTDATLKRIRAWPNQDFDVLLEKIQKTWHWGADWFRGPFPHEEDPSKKVYRVSTGGWSGNEEMIQALKEHLTFWTLCWEQSRRGGHYVFVVPKNLQGERV